MIDIHRWIIVSGPSPRSFQETYSWWRTKIANTIQRPAFVTSPTIDTEPKSAGHTRVRARYEYTTKACSDAVLSENWIQIRLYLNDAHSAADGAGDARS